MLWQYFVSIDEGCTTILQLVTTHTQDTGTALYLPKVYHNEEDIMDM